MATAAPLDTTIEVVTPENIAFQYQLAGPFRRLPAYLIDGVVKVAFVMVVGLLGMLSGVVLGPLMAVLGFAGINILWFLVGWFYGVVLETYFNGRTIGKWALGIRVVSTTGHPINGVQALLRNVLRVADMMPLVSLQTFDEEYPPAMIIPTGIVALVVMACTRRLQRLGDLAAGTMVVVDEPSWSLPVAKVDDPRVPALATFVPADFRATPSLARALAQYAERRGYLSAARRREVARHLADPLIERFEFRPDIDPDLLLYALYWRIYLADEHPEADLGALAGFSPLRKDMEPPNPPEPSP